VRIGVGLALAAWALGIFLASCEPIPVDYREPVTLRLLDGKSGEPLAHLRLVLIAGYDRKDLKQRAWRNEVITDMAGEALLPQALANFPFLEVRPMKTRLCQGTARGEIYTIAEIRGEGFSAPNRCGWITAAETPRTLVVFVRTEGNAAGLAQAAPAEPRVDYTTAGAGSTDIETNELSERLPMGEIGTGPPAREAGRALARIAASVGSREAERTGREQTSAWALPGGRNEIDVLSEARTGSSETPEPVLEGTASPAESYERMWQTQD